MIKRSLLLTGLILILIMGSVVFADDSEMYVERPTDEMLKASFEVFEPAISDDGILNVRDHLYISIKINQEYPILMDLYRIEETLPELESLNEEANEEPVNVPVVLITPQETDDSVPVLAVEEEEIPSDQPSESIDATLILDIAEPIEVVEEEEISRIQIINQYFSLEAQKNEALKTLIDAEELYLTAVTTTNETDESFESSEVVTNYESARVNFKAIMTKFEEMASQYNQLFETSVIETTTLAKTGVLPYFKMNVDAIDTGDYKLVFTYDGDEEAFRTIGFTVVSQELISEDSIATDISEILNELREVEGTE